MHVVFSGISVNGHVQKKVALRDIAKLKNHKFLFYLKVKSHMKTFFAHNCFKSCYGYLV